MKIKASGIFERQALAVAPKGQAFFYTSGLIGPFYVNTQYLYGGSQQSAELLAFIDQHKDSPRKFIPLLLKKLQQQYVADEIYRYTIDNLVSQLALLPAGSFNTVSGGERRDWFFAPLIAERLNLPLVYLYKNGHCFDSDGLLVTELSPGSKVLNVADLFNTASSFTELWQPQIKNLGGELTTAAAVIDRNQGANRALKSAGITQSCVLYTLEQDFFAEAVAENLLSSEQAEHLLNYLQDPEKTMRAWLIRHPDFIADACRSADPKTKERAEAFAASDPYQLS